MTFHLSTHASAQERTQADFLQVALMEPSYVTTRDQPREGFSDEPLMNHSQRFNDEWEMNDAHPDAHFNTAEQNQVTISKKTEEAHARSQMHVRTDSFEMEPVPIMPDEMLGSAPLQSRPYIRSRFHVEKHDTHPTDIENQADEEDFEPYPIRFKWLMLMAILYNVPWICIFTYQFLTGKTLLEMMPQLEDQMIN